MGLFVCTCFCCLSNSALILAHEELDSADHLPLCKSISHALMSLDKQKFKRKIENKSYISILVFVLCAQKNRLIETVLLSTNNICFG